MVSRFREIPDARVRSGHAVNLSLVIRGTMFTRLPTMCSALAVEGSRRQHRHCCDEYIRHLVHKCYFVLLSGDCVHQTAIWHLNNYLLIGSAYGPTLPAGWTLVAPPA